MKKTLVASILGLGLSATAFGQGVVQFNNYQSTSFQQVSYGNDAATQAALGALAGTPVTDPGVEVQLFWALGTFANQAAFNAAANAGVTTFINPLFTYQGGGYYGGPNQTLTGWTPAQTVTFEVEAWQTTGPHGGATFGQSGLSGVSGLWTEVAAANSAANGIQPAANPATFFNGGPPAMSIAIVPEPSVFALSGIGAAALMLIRRKK
jgi:hypothetical protein